MSECIERDSDADLQALSEQGIIEHLRTQAGEKVYALTDRGRAAVTEIAG